MISYQTLSLAEANLILDAAQRKAEEIGVPEVLCVSDNAGYPIALRRLENGKVTSVQIAMNKAFTAACHRKPTHMYKNAYPGEEAIGIYAAHRRIVFHGDGYAGAWEDEAAVRGLANLKTTPDALPHLVTPETVAVLRRMVASL